MTSLYDPKLYTLLDKRKQFLEANPSMLQFQEEIDEVLAKSGNTINRMATLRRMMREHVQSMQKNLGELIELCEKVTIDHER